MMMTDLDYADILAMRRRSFNVLDMALRGRWYKWLPILSQTS